MITCFVLFAGVTVWFITFEVNHAQHVFCQLMTTLSNAPAPKGDVTSTSNPARAYDIKIASDIVALKRNLGC